VANVNTAELARILRKAADKIAAGQTEGKLMDVNGNSVGEYGFWQGRTDGGMRSFRLTITELDNDAFRDD